MKFRSWRLPAILCVLIVCVACAGDDDDDDASSDADDDVDDDTDDGADDDTSGDDDGVAVPPHLDIRHPGPFDAGVTTVYFIDETRDLSCGEGKRSLMTEIWYPARAGDDTEESTVRDFFAGRLDEIAAAYEAIGNDIDTELIDLPTGAFRDAPFAADAPPAPVILFSHGFTSQRFQNYRTAAFLATHGYVVLAPDHICNAHVTCTPDAVVPMSLTDSLRTLDDRKADLSFLIDDLTDAPPEFLDGRIDVDRVGFWGHSFGGITVTEAIKTEPRARALVQQASFGFPPMPEGSDAPALFLWGRQDKWMFLFEDWHDGVIGSMSGPRFELEFDDSGHFAFCDLCDYNARLGAIANGCGTEPRIGGGGSFTNPTAVEMNEFQNPYIAALFGAAFFDEPELWNYLAGHHGPEWMDHFAYSD